MIKKIAEFLGRKVFIPKAELVETKPYPYKQKKNQNQSILVFPHQ